MECITPQVAADKITAYLHHDLSPAELTVWAEHAMMDGGIRGRIFRYDP